MGGDGDGDEVLWWCCLREGRRWRRVERRGVGGEGEGCGPGFGEGGGGWWGVRW